MDRSRASRPPLFSTACSRSSPQPSQRRRAETRAGPAVRCPQPAVALSSSVLIACCASTLPVAMPMISIALSRADRNVVLIFADATSLITLFQRMISALMLATSSSGELPTRFYIDIEKPLLDLRNVHHSKCLLVQPADNRRRSPRRCEPTINRYRLVTDESGRCYRRQSGREIRRLGARDCQSSQA